MGVECALLVENNFCGVWPRFETPDFRPVMSILSGSSEIGDRVRFGGFTCAPPRHQSHH